MASNNSPPVAGGFHPFGDVFKGHRVSLRRCLTVIRSLPDVKRGLRAGRVAGKLVSELE